MVCCKGAALVSFSSQMIQFIWENLFERSYANASSFTGAYRYRPSQDQAVETLHLFCRVSMRAPGLHTWNDACLRANL